MSNESNSRVQNRCNVFSYHNPILKLFFLSIEAIGCVISTRHHFKQLAPWLVALWWNLKDCRQGLHKHLAKSRNCTVRDFCCILLLGTQVQLSFYCVFLLCRCGEAKTHSSFSLEAMTLDVNSILPVRYTSVLSGSKREVISLLLLAVYRNWRRKIL